MKSQAPTAAAYLASLPGDRREALESVRAVVLRTLDAKAFEERMQYGVIGYCVPHRLWPHGHHTRPELPLMYMGLSSQKNDMVVYILFLQHNERERTWFGGAWKAAGKKAHLEVTGMGCCLRFKKIEDLALDVIARAIGRVPLSTYLKNHAAMLARMGKPPVGGTPDARAAKAARGAKPSTKPQARRRQAATPGRPTRAKRAPSKRA